MTDNHQVRLAARPDGLPTPEVWEHTTEPVPTPADGRFVVRVTHLSLDPAMRGWMNAGRSYVPPVGIGEVMRALGAGRVVASAHPDFPEGAHVTGIFGVQEYAESDGSGVLVVDPSVVPLATYLAVLGMTGMTAYFGLFDVGALREGETVVVSGAAGAVGSVVGQLARIRGCRVVGIAGGAEKCAWIVDELGFDAAIDYRSEDVGKALRTHAPDGVDVYFDNVGGDILDAALARLARGARVVVCGAISTYNATERPQGPANYMSLLVNRARMEGFVVFDYADRYAEAAVELGGWLREGKLRSREDVVRGGVADFPDTLLKLFRGENTGKLILQIAD
ncbi:NADP-dependent oxidoreductase [Pseudonocardia sp. KRD-184]|uniref:NADP-dependent oxidoreductase n=1 Tax=Pseudonocardia oceani TaxID=2792013 RepID=A0ABS6UAQ0_9PSEU|nr:NADP-dependent oxidoreductase [Pseudonocardia oceani]MBW0088384.1 NADP-dependent oxidoreductase [Pseudonocardia oceani]MBW0094952.1 NADP-dependent oxidoreductase [Pseudonocardia oceani]MBW0107772.1 NADP-dependent oxidoreductase [Pseudonocardia oceani]MBW0120230.1 NADP-dependent oxidoreductase [Pseudonocardia oceani]MBW0128954.1 NADP-dependent oxidoreductase [Pseudonocardia oceani]